MVDAKRRSALICRRTVASLAAAGTLAVAGTSIAHERGPSSAEPPFTRFEQFVTGACSPCAKESALIATLSVPAVTVTALSRTLAGRIARPGEVAVEALRASVIGRSAEQRLAVRLTLWIPAGEQGEMHRLSSGIVDAEEVARFVSALDRILATQPALLRGDAATQSMELDAHAGSVRVGVIGLKGESIAYVQAGDVRTLAVRPVWEAPSTLYLPVAELPKLRAAVSEAAARLQKVRGAD